MTAAKKRRTAVVHRMDSSRWSGRILDAWRKSVQSVLDVGKLLIDAKGDLKHGEFERMVEESLPFGNSDARRLMIVARHPQFSNRAHTHDLPSSWMTLYELTKLTNGQWEQAVEEKLIRADVQQKEIIAFRRKLDGKEKSEPKPYKDASLAEVELLNYLDKFMRRYPNNERERLAGLFRQLALDVLQTGEW